MKRGDLGPFGTALELGDDAPARARELSAAGYPTLWVRGGQLGTLDGLTDLIAATDAVRIGTGVVPIEVHPPSTTVELHRVAPDRLVVGLGGQAPLRAFTAYLDELDALGLPAADRLLAALGPRKLELARDRAAGAIMLLVTPEYAARARELLGPDAVLVVQHLVAIDPDPAAARAAVRGALGFLTQLPGYRAGLRRMGFSDAEIGGIADRLVDAVTAWGDLDTVAARLREYVDAGVDHLSISPVTPTGPLELNRLLVLASGGRD